MSAPATLSVPSSSPTPTAEARPSRWGQRVDVLIVGLVLLFGFVAGSFVARNSDLWLHLATGRALVSGQYHFGTDPFSYTTAGRYWANHSWLFDLTLYLGFQWLGGAGLVAIKAMAVAGVAALMLVLARGPGPAWVATGCVLLGLVAMTPRLLLQPTIPSLGLVVAILCCLREGGRWFYTVPILIALWVNLDSWFPLGPSMVGLFWLGRRLEGITDPAWRWWLLPASLVACLLSPHHVRALTLPVELSPAVWGSPFVTDPRFAGVFASPWQWAPLGAVGGYSLAAWAFFVLLGLGVLSFALNPRALRSWRGVVWLPFLILAVWQARLIPFFAVVAAPIAALNFRELLSDTAFNRAGRTVVFTSLLGFLGLGWCGLLTGFYNRERGVAWAVYTEPTLERAADGVARWRRQNAVPVGVHVFATHPDFAHYLAWFGQGDRTFLDSRLHLFTPVAGEFVALSRGVGLLPGGESERGRVGERLATHRLGAVALYDPDGGRMTRGISEVTTGQPGQWVLVSVDGNAVLLVPNGSPHALERFDAERAVFGLPADNDVTAAEHGPATLAEPKPWWEPRPRHGRQGSWEADAATVYLRLFENTPPRGEGQSPALPLLAVRAARRGSEIDPADATAWLMLARAYSGLSDRTWEREAGDSLTLLGSIRQVQLTTALVQAALHYPDSIPTHDALVAVFVRRQAFDLAHQHAVEVLRLVRRAGPAPGESSAEFTQRVDQAAEQVDQLEGFVQNAENRFLVRTTGMTGDPLARARIAGELGLHQRAIDVLQSSHPDLYGVEGLGLLAELLLQTGKAGEARVFLDRPELKQHPGALGLSFIPGKPHPGGHRWSYRLPAYVWLDLCESAAAGNYSSAFAAINQLTAWLDSSVEAQEPDLRLQLLRVLGLEFGQALPVGRTWGWVDTAVKRGFWADALGHTKFLTVARADLDTLAGVLELERGNATGAAQRFAQAQLLYDAARGVAPSLPGEPLATRYADAIRRHR